MSEEEKGIRVSVTFPSKDAEWLQQQVERGEYTTLAEVVRMSVRTMREGGLVKGISIPLPEEVGQGKGIVIPTEVAVEAIRNPEIIAHLIGTLKSKGNLGFAKAAKTKS